MFASTCVLSEGVFQPKLDSFLVQHLGKVSTAVNFSLTVFWFILPVYKIDDIPTLQRVSLLLNNLQFVDYCSIGAVKKTKV